MGGLKMEFKRQGFDHVEFVVKNSARMESIFKRMGFQKMGERKLPSQGTQSVLYAQGAVRLMLTQPLTGALENLNHSASLQFLEKQAEGICVLAVEVADATQAFEETVKRGARVAREPQVFKSQNQGMSHQVIRAEIWTPGNVRYAFIQRILPPHFSGPVLFDEELMVSSLECPSPRGIQAIDHLTNNVGMGKMKDWVEYYREIFGFKVTRHFDIRTNRTGLLSDVVESFDRKIKVPINEPTEKESQIQEFVDRMRGPGIQHLALLTSDLPQTLRALREQQFQFLTVPHTYYEAVPTRIQGVTENLLEMEDLGILLDGEGKGYLLQIFSEEILGPFFMEYIQRKGNEGFGEGNFRALFEAIERDQIKRGVLKR